MTLEDLDGACTHPVGLSNGGWSYEPNLDLWVHGAKDCRRPSRATLKMITLSEGGMAF